MGRVTGGAILARMLQTEGVEKVFGIIDGTYTGFYVALDRLGIEIVTPRHETSAAHMAGAYARVTGRLGVCMASNGPGVANLLPGLVVEQAEGNRVLAITSARRPGVSAPDRGGAYQCFDQVGVISRIAKWSERVATSDRLGELARRALRHAFDGRPGVVHLDVPETVMNGTQPDEPSRPPSSYRTTSALEPSQADLDAVLALLAGSDAPMLHVGSGVVHAQAFDALQRVAEALHAPVTTSWAARGALTERSPLAIPMPHIELASQVRRDADLVLAVGARFGETDWWGKAPYWGDPAKQRCVHVDIDEQSLGQHKPITLGIRADAGRFLSRLADALQRAPVAPERLSARQRRVGTYASTRTEERTRWNAARQHAATPMHPAQVPAICQEVFPERSVLVADGGNTAIWTMFHTEARVPNRVLSTFKFGMLGAGTAQAIGAALALPDTPVCCITGDGAMGFHPQEIETAVRVGARVVFVVLCDRQWGMVKINQQFKLHPIKTLLRARFGPDDTIGTDFGEIAFDALARSCGAHGERVSNAGELRPALERALASGGCAVVHVDVDPVRHLWAPGLLHFKKMHEEPGG
jgi:acetolactate synthase-1/2/3 large subunit